MEKLIVVFVERRNIGITAIPYFAHIIEDKPIELLEHATVQHLKNEPSTFTEDEKSIIEILHRISDNYIFKKYSKEGTLKEFFDNLHKDRRFIPMIKVYIEKYLYDTVRLLAKTNIPTYYKKAHYNVIYQSDLLKIEPTPAIPICYFELNQNELLYSLKIRQLCAIQNQEIELSLQGKDLNFILMEPAVFINDYRLYYFDKIDGNKFKPFVEKSAISVINRQIPSYMEKFVLKCIRKYAVVAKGFEIVETERTPEIILKIIKNLKQKPVIALHFKYGDRTFLADMKSEIFAKLEIVNNNYRFVKIQRDLIFEKQINKLLVSMGLKNSGDAIFDINEASYFDETNNQLSFLVDWINKNVAQLEQNKITFIPEYEDKKFFIGQYSISLDSKIINDWFEIHSTVIVGIYKIPFLKFKKNLIDNDPVYVLPNGEHFMIPPEWFSRFSDLFDFSIIEGKKLLLPRYHFELIEKINNTQTYKITFPEVKLPEGLNAEMRPYQIDGFQWLNFIYQNNFGGILSDDMGLGKTLQAISLLLKIYKSAETVKKNIKFKGTQLSLFEQPENIKNETYNLPASLICMPTSLIFNWNNELKKFAPDLKIYTYSGENRIRSKDIGKIFNHYHAVLTSYGIVRNDIEILSNYNFHYFILDESQYVKNPNSKIYDAVKQIKADRFLMLSGTPVENSLMDLWTQMDIINHGLLGTHTFFKRNFVTPITQNNDDDKISKLQNLIRPFFLRRTKDKVAADLPPVMEQTLFCEMSPEQRKFYDREKYSIKNTLSKIFESQSNRENSIIALQALTRLRQIANHPVLIDKKFDGTSGKFEQILENLENIVAEQHNVLVFSSFVKDLELLQTELQKRNLKYEMLIGKTVKRKQVIDKFFNEQRCQIFLITLKTGGVGLNLTKADYVFLLNPWWNPAAEEQAISRAHRIGQTKNVFVYRFISIGTIEEKIARLQKAKRELADIFISRNNPLKDMSKEEILELFG
ncbi:MAG: DEAD/DEAH box helicase [Marinilabiliaceae bacterium]|nr:DEAD/DEAH box helicase [Marinilabiliaceae bacterium]